MLFVSPENTDALDAYSFMEIALDAGNVIHGVTVWGCGNVVIAFTLASLSNKTIIFIHASDPALFIAFLSITHTLTKLKRLLTFDNSAGLFFFTIGPSQSQGSPKEINNLPAKITRKDYLSRLFILTQCKSVKTAMKFRV